MTSNADSCADLTRNVAGPVTVSQIVSVAVEERGSGKETFSEKFGNNEFLRAFERLCVVCVR